MKIFGIGVNKTGTKSLGEALSRLGFNHRAWSRETYEIYKAGGIPGLLELVGQYDSFEDWPWPLVYREIDEAVPGCKFILTLRESPEIWYQSLCKHAMRTGPNIMRSEIYGYALPQMSKKDHIAVYNEHVDSVRDYFRNRPDDLLEVCWGRGDGWAEIASFLACRRPDEPFPHKNRSES